MRQLKNLRLDDLNNLRLDNLRFTIEITLIVISGDSSIVHCQSSNRKLLHRLIVNVFIYLVVYRYG